MAAPAQAPLPQALDLPDGFSVEFGAIDPVTGDDVPGVVISNASLTVTDAAGDVLTFKVGNPILLGVGG